MLREVLQKVTAFFGGTMEVRIRLKVKVFSPFSIQSRMLLEVSQRPTVFFESMVFGTYTKSIDKQEMHGLQILHIQKFNVNWKGKGKYFYNFTTFIIEIARHAMFLQGGR